MEYQKRRPTKPDGKHPQRAKLTLRTIAKLTPEAKRYRVLDTEIPNYYLAVHPSGKMSYCYVYRTPQGKRPTFVIGTHGPITPAQARQAAAAKAAEVRLGGDPQGERKKARQERAIPTLRQYIEGDYSEWALAHRKSGKATVARILATYGDEFGNTRLDKITAWNFEKLRSRRLKNGMQPSTINRDYNALLGALTKAREWGKIASNPLTGIKALAVDDSPNVRYLDKPEEKRLRDALDAREERLRAERDTGNVWRRARDVAEMRNLRMVAYADHLKPMVLVSMHTGMRRGELFQLTWVNVNLGESALLTVVGRTAKKLKTRYIPLNNEALDVLRGWKSQQDTTDGLVFRGRDGQPFNSAKKAWAGVLRAASITKFRWHDLRHHFASRLVMAGVDLNTVRELLGHSDIKMTLRYAHLAPEHKAAAVARLVDDRAG